ncbi:phthiocerol/phthiodiolone dimycocerosyl transferase family protein [Nocardia niigatensis]
MSSQRPLSPFEVRHFDPEAKWGNAPKADCPLFVSSTVRGGIDIDVLRAVLAELAAGHVLLRAEVIEDADGARHFRLREDFEPVLEVAEGGEDAYLALLSTAPDWSRGFIQAKVLREGDRTQIVLILHHGMSDGRSAFALAGEMWQRYTARLSGSPLPPSDSDAALVDGADNQLARTITGEQVDEFLAQLRMIATTADPALAARTLPPDGDGSDPDPLGRIALQRIELTAEETTGLVSASRVHEVSVNSLLAGAALTVVRAHIEADAAPVPMVAGHAVDVRSELVPPLTESNVLNCVGGLATPVFAAADPDPVELAKMIELGMRSALDAHVPALFMCAGQRRLDPEVSALFAAQPTLGFSNLGRVPAHPLPAGLESVRDEVFAMAVNMPPKMTIFTVGDRLTVQVEFDTAWNSYAQMGPITDAMRAQVAALCAAAVVQG